MTARASDYGQPRIRVRRLPDQRGLLRSRRCFEVEYTPFGADEPEWTKQTSRPEELIAPYISGTDRYDLVRDASRRWKGGVGPWSSLFTADE